MILYLNNGQQIRGDIIKSAVLRSDLAPIPITLEAEIRTDEDMLRRLAESELITVSGNSSASGDALRIIKSESVNNRLVQGDREMDVIRITALLDACHTVAFTRNRSIIKENATLSAIYRAAGASIKSIDTDLPVARFYCLVGDTPSFQIAKVLQEEGGVVRWKSGRLKFFRLPDLFKQAAITELPHNSSDDINSGFLERHEVPWFFSTDDSGAYVYGNQNKVRSVRYAPFKNAQQLRNMSRCLVQRKISKINPDMTISAGDLISFVGGESLCVITAAHVFESGTDGSRNNQYTRLWLGSLEE